MALLGRRQFDVEFLEARFAGGAALVEFLELGVDLGQFVIQLRRARLRLLGLLRQPQQFDLQLMRAALRLGRVATRRGQMRGGAGVSRFGADQRAARFLGDQRLRAQLAVEVLDLLRTRQQAGLLGVGRIERDRVRAGRVAFARHQHLAVLQA